MYLLFAFYNLLVLKSSCGALCNVGLEERSINKGYYYRAETQSNQCQSDCGVRGQTVKMVVSLCLFPDLPAWLPISQRVGWPPYTCSSLPVCPSSTRLSQHPSTDLTQHLFPFSLSPSHLKLSLCTPPLISACLILRHWFTFPLRFKFSNLLW